MNARLLKILSLFIAAVGMLGCDQIQQKSTYLRTTTQPHSVEKHAASLLSRADGVCLAKITRVVEKNEMPSDGDHFQEIWIEPVLQSGNIPDWILVVIQHGGNMPLESIQELEKFRVHQQIQPGTLQLNKLYWFIFSDAYDSSKLPYRVAGWWAHEDRNVPEVVVSAIQTNQLRLPRKWNSTLDLLATWQSSPKTSTLNVKPVEPSTNEINPIEISTPGSISNVSFFHHHFSYELTLENEEELDLVYVETRGHLLAGNEFDLPKARYRINYAFDLSTGRKIAQWVASDQEVWLLKAFRQYNSANGTLARTMKFELLKEGGLSAGSDSEHWYRKTITTYGSNGRLITEHFRHQYIKHGDENAFSSTHWLPVSDAYHP